MKTHNLWAVERANGYVALMTALICFTLIAGYTQDVLRERITLSHYLTIICVIAVQLLICFFIYFRNKSSNYYKYFALIGYTFVYCIAIFIRASYFTYVFIFPVTMLYSLYENLRLIKIISIGTGILNVLKIIYQINAGNTSQDDITGYVIQAAFVALIGAGMYMNTLLAININKRKVAEIVDYAQKADEANKSKSNFLASMSHEIRTPMNAIIGISQIELQKEELSNDYKSALHKIYQSGNTLLGIINDILDMSKIETGKMELNNAEYDVPSFINDTVQLNIVRIGSKPIEFKLELEPNLPSRLYGDELRLKQIMNNLLSNAIKYTEKGYVKLSVKHAPQGENTMLSFIVEDTGQGLKPEDKAKLFSEYTRFNMDANRTTEGTGIGLNITKSLVEMMSGTITVESEYGKGSIFTVTVMQKSIECEVIGEELSERLRSFSFSGEKQFAELQINRFAMPYGKVLVVDDVETNLYVAEGLLLPYQIKVDTAISGFSAIKKTENGALYDIIFMDHMMPLMDGIETTRKLRENGYKGVIVALTANALAGNDVMFKQNGFDDFLSKPIDIRQMNAILNKYIRNRHPEEAKKQALVSVSGHTEITPPAVNLKLLQVFSRDAVKAIETIRETAAAGNIKLFTTTVHAMKSALANIGEEEKSKQAYALEQAGNDGNMEFISANTEDFVKTLEALIKSLTPPKNADTTVAETDIESDEDINYLITQLKLIEKACGDYNDTAACAVLDKLKEKSWRKEISDVLENIRDALYIDSDFEKAGELAAESVLSCKKRI